MKLIDTNIFVDHLRNYPQAVAFFEALEKQDEIIFSAITEAELLAGKANDNQEKKEKLLHFLHRWEKISVTNHLAVLAGEVSRKYDVSIPDAIIAATALSYYAVLVTRNTKDFQKVPGLRVEKPY